MDQITDLDGTITSGDWSVSKALAKRSSRPTLVQGDLALVNVILTQADEDSVLSSLSSN
jgi:aminoglycoside phosphotransferase (APT) family kinase protein